MPTSPRRDRLRGFTTRVARVVTFDPIDQYAAMVDAFAQGVLGGGAPRSPAENGACRRCRFWTRSWAECARIERERSRHPITLSR